MQAGTQPQQLWLQRRREQGPHLHLRSSTRAASAAARTAPTGMRFDGSAAMQPTARLLSFAITLGGTLALAPLLLALLLVRLAPAGAEQAVVEGRIWSKVMKNGSTPPLPLGRSPHLTSCVWGHGHKRAYQYQEQACVGCVLWLNSSRGHRACHVPAHAGHTL